MDVVRTLGGARDAVVERLRLRQQHRWEAVADIDPSVVLPYNARLSPRTSIGAGTTFAGSPNLSGTGRIDIGRWTAIGEEFCAITTNHDLSALNMHYRLARQIGVELPEVDGVTTIGSAAWIGNRVLVLAGATIGDGAVVGAGSVVTGTIPPFAVAVGVPCRALRPRFPDPIVDVLLELRWWDWSVEEMTRARGLFEMDLSTASPSQVRQAAEQRHPRS